MHVRRVHIENVRGFRSGVQAVDLDLGRARESLAGWTVLAGRNGSGKTTLLQSIALALLGRSPWSVDELASAVHEGEQRAEVVVGVRPGSDDAASDGDIVCSFAWELHQEGSTLVRQDPSNRGILEHQESFFAGYGPFRRLSGHTSDAQRLMSALHGESCVVTLFREDASLAEAVAWLREVNYRKLEAKPSAVALEKAALLLLDDGLLPGVQVENVDSAGLWVRRNGSRLPLSGLSDGYRGVTALVLDILRHLQQKFGGLEVEEREGRATIPYAGVVLIDEVDAHLHVTWQQEIGFWLKDHFPNLQFIVTTHSPFICQAADPGALIRLPAPGDDRPVEPVPEEVYHAVVNGTIDEAVLSELFGLDSPYSAKAERLRRQVARLEARLQIGDVSEAERAELIELRRRLPRSMASDVEQALRHLALTA